MKVKYPDIEIKFIFPDTDKNNQDDQLKSLYTAIMAGSGPDVIDVSEMPHKKLAEKKLLVNLSEIIDNDKEFDKSLYYQNIIDAAKYNGILYIMPVNYMFVGFAADDEVLDEENIAIDDSLWTWDDFYNISLKLNKDTDNDSVIDRYAFYSIEHLMETRFLPYIMHSQFVDPENKSCSFNTEECVDFLNTYKKLMESNIRHPVQELEPVRVGALSKQFVFMPAVLFDAVSFNAFKSYIGTAKVGFYQFPRNIPNNKVSCKLKSALGINANSKLKDESWNLIKCMLREEVQSSGWLTSTINKNAERKRDQDWMEGTLNILDQSEFEKLNSLRESCNDILYVDNEVFTIIKNETRSFFNGQKTAEETAQAIQDKVTTCLNE